MKLVLVTFLGTLVAVALARGVRPWREDVGGGQDGTPQFVNTGGQGGNGGNGGNAHVSFGGNGDSNGGTPLDPIRNRPRNPRRAGRPWPNRDDVGGGSQFGSRPQFTNVGGQGGNGGHGGAASVVIGGGGQPQGPAPGPQPDPEVQLPFRRPG